MATGVLLVLDLDQPKRFLYVLLRPHWASWLVRGGYLITVFGGMVTLLGVALYFGWETLGAVVGGLTAITAAGVAVYTAFLFAQAKGRDFWQSPTLALHMLAHSILAGAAILALVALVSTTGAGWLTYLRYVLLGAIGVNLLVLLIELSMTHPTEDAKRTVDMILRGRYATKFYAGTLVAGNLVPIALLLASGSPVVTAAAGLLVLIGIYFTEAIWVEAPQRIPLT
jgi:formate-dependent nitrite reductase membrane component NrfD